MSKTIQRSTQFIVLGILVFFSFYNVVSYAATEIPKSLAGRWIVQSFSINGEEVQSLHTLLKDGSLWKLFDDGEGICASTDVKYEYDSEKSSFNLWYKDMLGFYSNKLINGGDIALESYNVVIKWTDFFGNNNKLVLRPEKKGRQVNGLRNT